MLELSNQNTESHCLSDTNTFSFKEEICKNLSLFVINSNDSYPLLYSDIQTFMKKLLESNKTCLEMTELEHIINQTQHKFFRTNNDSCLVFGLNENEVFLSMKDENGHNEFCQVVAKLNLSTGTVQTCPGSHSNYIISFAYCAQTNSLVTGSWDQSICLYDASTMLLTQQIEVGKGIVQSLHITSELLFVGSIQYVSLFKLNMNYNEGKQETQLSLIQHTNLQDEHVYFATMTECDSLSIWMAGLSSNKIYNISLNESFETELQIIPPVLEEAQEEQDKLGMQQSHREQKQEMEKSGSIDQIRVLEERNRQLEKFNKIQNKEIENLKRELALKTKEFMNIIDTKDLEIEELNVRNFKLVRYLENQEKKQHLTAKLNNLKEDLKDKNHQLTDNKSLIQDKKSELSRALPSQNNFMDFFNLINAQMSQTSLQQNQTQEKSMSFTKQTLPRYIPNSK